jgi:putative polyketide hydroxylase
MRTSLGDHPRSVPDDILMVTISCMCLLFDRDLQIEDVREIEEIQKRRSTMSTTRYPVLIVGAGAAGLTASTLLAHHGVRSLTVEKRKEVFLYPKARNLTFRSLEILRGVGLGPAVNAAAHHISYMVSKTTLSSADTKVVMDSEYFPDAQALSPEPFGKYCPQSVLEPILLDETRRRGSDVRYATALDSFRQHDDGVVATIEDLDTGAVSEVHADYLLAADGTHSPIRGTLGIGTSGAGRIPIFVVFIYFRAPWRQYLPTLGDGDGVQVGNPKVNGIMIPVHDDLALFTTTYFPSEGETLEMFTPDRCRELLLDAFGTDVPIEVVDVAPWQPHEIIADQFRCGRVFLVGDSAHTMPPLKGGGANTGIQSAQNLAWKLAAVLHGTAGAELLDTYHTERHPVGRFAARQSLTGPGAAYLPLGPDAPKLPPDEDLPLFYMIAGYKYRSAAVVTDEPAAPDPDGVQLVDGEELHGEPGTRVPHAWVQRDGERISTLDLLGTGFTLITGTAGTSWVTAAESVSGSLDVPIDVCVVGADVSDADGQWAEVTGLSPGGALLVRPDDFIGWRTDALARSPEGELGAVMRRILARS